MKIERSKPFLGYGTLLKRLPAFRLPQTVK
jgi:hypothetical protein